MSWLKNDNGRSLTSFFVKRGRDLEYVRAGSTFQRVHRDCMVKTAQVLSVGTDSYGIPHVRSQASFRRPNQSRFDGGGRMLALKSFADQYRERVSALKAQSCSHKTVIPAYSIPPYSCCSAHFEG